MEKTLEEIVHALKLKKVPELPMLSELIRIYVWAVIEATAKNKPRAARILGISLMTLDRYMRGHVVLTQDETIPFISIPPASSPPDPTEVLLKNSQLLDATLEGIAEKLLAKMEKVPGEPISIKKALSFGKPKSITAPFKKRRYRRKSADPTNLSSVFRR